MLVSACPALAELKATFINRTDFEIQSISIKGDGGSMESVSYTHLLAAGASKPGVLKLEAGEAVNALDFLAEFKAKDGKLDIGKNVVVIGGGNTAMDTARAAKRTAGVEHVYLVYRRTKRYMPADAEELEMAVEDGVCLLYTSSSSSVFSQVKKKSFSYISLKFNAFNLSM